MPVASVKHKLRELSRKRISGFTGQCLNGKNLYSDVTTLIKSKCNKLLVLSVSG